MLQIIGIMTPRVPDSPHCQGLASDLSTDV